MNFIDRQTLGESLAGTLQDLRDKDAIIVCMKESSLLTCLTIASQIRAWVYPLIYVPVHRPGHTHDLLGAFDQDGKFCPLPDTATAKTAPITDKEMEKVIKKHRPAALKTIKQQTEAYGLTLDKKQLDGRDVILAADIITSALPLVLAQRLLLDVTPKSVTAAAGNVTPDAAQLIRINADKVHVLDVMSGVFYDDNRYFEHADTYTLEQKHTLTKHIAAYWQ